MPQGPYRRSLSPERLRQLRLELEQPAPLIPEPEPSATQKWGPTAIRGIGGLFGMNPVTGAAAGAVSEGLAQALEGDIDPRRILAAGAVGATGGGLARTILKFAGKPVQAAVRGGLLGASAPAAKSIIEEGELPEPMDVATGGALGAATGGGLAKLMGIFQRKAPTTPSVALQTPYEPQSLVDLISNKSGKDIEALALRTEAMGGPGASELANQIRDLANQAGKAVPVSQTRLIAAQKAQQTAAERANVAAAKAQAKTAEEAGAARRIEGIKEGLQPKQQVSETISAPIEGGKKTLKTIFQKKREPRPGRRPATELPPEGTPQHDIYQEWIAAGRDPKTALRLAIAGRRRIAQPGVPEAAIPEVPAIIPESPPLPRTPEEVEAYMARKQAEAAEAPQGPLAQMLSPEPAQVPEVPPTGIPGPREAILGQSQEAADTLEDIQRLSGGAGARAAEAAMPPAGVPDIPTQTPVDEVSALQRFLKGEALPEGPLRPPSPKGAEAIARAQQQFSPEANTKLDALRRVLNFSSDEDRGAAVKLMREIQGKEMGLPQGVIDQPLGPPPAKVSRSKMSPPSKMRPEELRRGVMDEAERLLAEGASEEDAINLAKQSFMDRLKKLGGEGGRRGGAESGVANPELLTRAFLGLGGAALGGATDPLDNPLLSAAGGAAIGLSLPTLARHAGELFQRVQTDPTVHPKIKEVAQAMSSGDQEKIAGVFWRDLPNYLRANMLISPNILNNAWSGPWGAGMAAGLELKMAGDPIGDAILGMMTPGRWSMEYRKALPEARQLIFNTAAMQKERWGEAVATQQPLMQRLLSGPAIAMMAGDIATRNVLKAAGLSDDIARKYTLTSEPATRLLKSITNIQRSGPIGQMLLPFARTIANIVEQGVARTPFIGPLVQAKVPGLRYSPAVQAQQQILGTAVPTIAAGLGYVTPEGETPTGRIGSNFLRSAVTNVAGPYSGLAAIGFGAGKAAAGPRADLGDVVKRAGTEAFQSIPLPTTDVPQSAITALGDLLSGELPERFPSGSVPFASTWNQMLRGTTGATGRPRRPSRSSGNR